MLTVVHRSDNLLQNNVARGVEPGLEETYIGKYTIPIHKAMLEFLDSELVGKEFPDEKALYNVLQRWPDRLQAAGITEPWIIEDWELITYHGVIMTLSEGPGGHFHAALYGPVEVYQKKVDVKAQASAAVN